jgi:KaiC/GvpD/RAD55 family RecA-like ATPase
MSKEVNRAVSVDDILKKKFIELSLPPKFKKLIGEPERSGVWIVWGNSFNGKTSFCMQLAKALTASGKVFYNTLEEGARKSFREVIVRENMQEVKRRFIIGDRETMDEIKDRLRKRKSPDIVFIDSLQYTGITKSEFKELKREFPRKLFVFVSHAEGKEPAGAIGRAVKYDADIKIRVEGYQATCLSRLGGDKNPYIIWEEGAKLYNIEIK